MIKKLKLFAEQLRTLNPNHAQKIRVVEHLKVIRLFNISPQSLKCPEGYHWEPRSYVITNKGNVPFWKVKKYHVVLRKKM